MSFSALTNETLAISGPYLQKIEENNKFWDDSPFDWMRYLSSRTRGKVGLVLGRSIFVHYGYKLEEKRNSFEVNGANVITRSSMLWASNVWRFQQVRNTQFDFLFCLGFYPDSASAWLIPKESLYSGGELHMREGWERQHGGKSGKEDAWLRVSPHDVPKWLEPFGGNIETIPKVLKKALG